MYYLFPFRYGFSMLIPVSKWYFGWEAEGIKEKKKSFSIAFLTARIRILRCIFPSLAKKETGTEGKEAEAHRRKEKKKEEETFPKLFQRRSESSSNVSL